MRAFGVSGLLFAQGALLFQGFRGLHMASETRGLRSQRYRDGCEGWGGLSGRLGLTVGFRSLGCAVLGQRRLYGFSASLLQDLEL